MAKAAPGVNLEMDGAWISIHKVWRVSSSGWDGRGEARAHAERADRQKARHPAEAATHAAGFALIG